MRVVDAQTTFADREALAVWLDVSEMTVRRYCGPAKVGVDAGSGRVLYDAEKAALLLEAVTGRPARRGMPLGRRGSAA